MEDVVSRSNVQQNESELLKEAYDVNALLESIRDLNPAGERTAMLADIALEKLERFFDRFDGFSHDLHALADRAEVRKRSAA